jgi:hypothetical protein
MVHRVGLDDDRQIRLSTPNTLAPANDAHSVKKMVQGLEHRWFDANRTEVGFDCSISPSSPTPHDEGCTLRRTS